MTGIPIPRGLLRDPGSACLRDAAGEPVPAFFDALTHWSPRRTSVKWLRALFLSPCVTDQRPEFVLELGGNATAMGFPSPVTVADEEQRVRLENGPLSLAVPKTRFKLEILQSAKIWNFG